MKRNKEEGIPDEVRQHWAPDEPTLEGPPPEEIISEFGAGVLDRVYRVLRSFRLDRYQLAGPPVEVKADTLVRLKPESAQELLTEKGSFLLIWRSSSKLNGRFRLSEKTAFI